MKRLYAACFLVLCLGLFLPVSVLFADEDPSTYQVALYPDFKVSGESYGKFMTPVYDLESSLDNLLISVDMVKSPASLVRCYARFQHESDSRWTNFLAFETEFSFADIRPFKAYQLLFIVRDPEKGNTLIQRITVQGRKLGEDLMKGLAQKPVEYEPANASFPKPVIVSRADWKARPPKGEYTPQAPQKIVIHHSWSPKQAQYTGAGTIRGIQNYHMDDAATGWMDIGYHFLIGPDGVIFQGRPEGGVGAHCPPNTNMVGICLIGDYDPGNDLLNAKIETSLVNLLSWLSSKYKIDPRLYYYGHRNFSSKTCPGDLPYDRIPTYRELVLKNIGGKK